MIPIHYRELRWQVHEAQLELAVTKGKLEELLWSALLKWNRSRRHRKKQVAQNLRRVRAVAEQLHAEARGAA